MTAPRVTHTRKGRYVVSGDSGEISDHNALAEAFEHGDNRALAGETGVKVTPPSYAIEATGLGEPTEPTDPVEPGPDPEPGPGPKPTPEPTPGKMRIGFNPGQLGYWLTETPFIDLMDGQATWREKQGEFVAFAGSGATPPVGEYTVSPREAATVEVGNTVRIKPNPGFESGDFSVYLPGFGPESDPIHSDYRKLIGSIGAACVRTMPWQQTNNGPDRIDWPDRMKLDDRRVDDKWGARLSIEVIANALNEMQIPGWLCVPRGATEGYVRGTASLLKTHYPSNLSLAIEFDNELWNPSIGGGRWMKRQGGGKVDHGVWASKLNWIAELFREEWGDDADRLVFVLAGQQTNAWHAEQVAMRLKPGVVGAIACTGYFANGMTSLDGVMDDIHGKRRDGLLAHKKLANDLGVPLWVYEGGPHPSNDAPLSIHRSDAMYDATIANLQMAQEVGVDLFNIFDLCGPYTGDNRFGHIEYMDQPLTDAPKLRAVVDFAKAQQ